jgi:diguanylate cyclase (GGDEF)-like protein/PAS domain S-box-containing protein
MHTKTYTSLASFGDLLVDAVFAVDSNANVVFASAACLRIFGYTPQEIVGMNMFDMMLPEDRERTRQSITDVMCGSPQLHFENRYVRKDGQVVDIMWAARWLPEDQVRIGVARDITERKRAEARHAALYAISEAAHTTDDLCGLIAHIHKIIGTLLPAANVSVVLHDEKTDQLTIPYSADQHGDSHELVSTAAGTPFAQIIGSGQSLLLTADMICCLEDKLPLTGGKPLLCWLGVPLRTHTGTIGVLVLKSYQGESIYSEKDLELLQFVSLHIANAIERQSMQARLQQMAQYDQLTGLPNRGLLYDRLNQTLSTARREGTGFAVLYLDLDKFKSVNDTLGHGGGDLLLQMVAERLKQCVRESDTVARIGGDEFVVLLPHINEPAHAAQVVKKIRNVFSLPLGLGGHSLSVSPSIGTAHYPLHGESPEQLLRHADKAMYSEKGTGKSPHAHDAAA